MLLVVGHHRELERRMRLVVVVVVRRSLDEGEVGLHIRHEEAREIRILGEEERHSLEGVERRSRVQVEEVGRSLGVGHMADMGCEMVVEEHHIDQVAGSHGAAAVGRIAREEVL